MKIMDTSAAAGSASVSPRPYAEGKSESADDHPKRSLWYKGAIIYQLHVRSFFDSNGDGVGDFCGLLEKLDHIVDLGADAVWLLPFFPSPLKDDGYDISDYCGVNPAYGSLDDFRAFVAAAHERGLKVLIELVVNHTSDQHPWFQRARQAPAGSPERDYYVWSETGHEFSEARVIFLDSETSNWAWDPVARAYYWHRFYSHQPDLNFDNPRVVAEVEAILDFWLGLGVDGFRLDAVPYLVEREDTCGENLAETHDVLKLIRRKIEERNPECVLLAEANQSPQDTIPYFGRGDECHMAFHFPLMPRLFMALAEEHAEPIVSIIQSTMELPDGCQWAIFLRNHDELTLEMVSEEERERMWQFYATHRRLRINLGIRRRLASLVDGDRKRIELLNGLLFSLPGTPVVYYGDEIGMSDNPFLGDRDGVRTPMQWSSDRNGGFSRANTMELFLPPVVDPLFGYEAVNVETQRQVRSSLLNFMRWIIKVRREHPVFGHGAISFIATSNSRLLVYTRSHEGETVLCVANLSETAQAASIDLSDHQGATPIDLFGGCKFPTIGDWPYQISLPGHSFFWLKLVPDDALSDDEGLCTDRGVQPSLPTGENDLGTPTTPPRGA
ncbi:maltose alpha-D-glucosyltransferase/ alpha-amylase [Consotaella salsifontis]|uniref:maltose alpha-D-glucosyltransferase n=1 Tax=Consotaella salsifontis TaxID=1365950 RepID=A0A1T4NIE7_9HYPH|nr:maltose alpha-D-glucosyltransferase/ alpha-amylase [Consotaella salsifontis]